MKKIRKVKTPPKKTKYFKTGIKGLDDLLEEGIPRGSAILIAGGAGSGKTLLCLNILKNVAERGEKCLYMSFEESEKKLKEHMEKFGWNPKELERKRRLIIKRFSLFDINRAIEALLAKEKGELLIDFEPIILPENFVPSVIAVDSLTAIASAFTGKRESYRIYIEQLFRFFEKIGATSFLISETEQFPKRFSPTGVEEFLADGVIVLYHLTRGGIREHGIEILKMRGAKHKKKIVPMKIISGVGIEVYPQQELFVEMEKEK